MVATTDQKARLLDLVTGVLELTRDGKRDIEEVCDILQLIKSEPRFWYLFTGGIGPTVKGIQKRERELKSRPVPADDEWFELEVDNDQDPMDVVTSAGFDKKSWTYLGPVFSGTQTYLAKLVRLGLVRNLADARERAAKLGLRLLEGQAREAFKTKYSVPDGKGGSFSVVPSGGARAAKRSCLLSSGAAGSGSRISSGPGSTGATTAVGRSS